MICPTFHAINTDREYSFTRSELEENKRMVLMRWVSLKLSGLWIQDTCRVGKWDDGRERETAVEMSDDSSMFIMEQPLNILKIISVFLFWHTPVCFLSSPEACQALSIKVPSPRLYFPLDALLHIFARPATSWHK